MEDTDKNSTTGAHAKISIVLPAKNEATALGKLLPQIRALYPSAEILVVNDGSTDNTADVCASSGARMIEHRYSIGNGGAVKSGAREAKGQTLVFMDADGQHNPADISGLLEKMARGYDMVVGARTAESQASWWRGLANRFYNRLASWVTGHSILDLTSGFRAVNATKFRRFLYLLPNGFSYPTTSTMAFFRAGYAVGYIPIKAGTRDGTSHIRLVRDGVRFLLIIFRIGTLYSPFKVFVPASFLFFIGGLSNYAYTYITAHRFTNMSALLLITSVLIFLMGLISEQVSNLLYVQSSAPSDGVKEHE